MYNTAVSITNQGPTCPAGGHSSRHRPIPARSACSFGCIAFSLFVACGYALSENVRHAQRGLKQGDRETGEYRTLRNLIWSSLRTPQDCPDQSNQRRLKRPTKNPLPKFSPFSLSLFLSLALAESRQSPSQREDPLVDLMSARMSLVHPSASPGGTNDQTSSDLPLPLLILIRPPER